MASSWMPCFCINNCIMVTRNASHTMATVCSSTPIQTTNVSPVENPSRPCDQQTKWSIKRSWGLRYAGMHVATFLPCDAMKTPVLISSMFAHWTGEKTARPLIRLIPYTTAGMVACKIRRWSGNQVTCTRSDRVWWSSCMHIYGREEAKPSQLPLASV